MNENIVAVVFNSHTQAEEAAMELRQQGVSDQSISIVAREDGTTTHTDGGGEGVAEKAGDTAKGALGGGALGAALGIAALAIPGVGPLVGAGAIAASAAGGAAATGAAIGAVSGGLVGLLTDHGVDEHDARYFEQHINQGGVFMSVDTHAASVSPEAVRDILERNGGHRAERSQSGAGLGASPSM